MPFQAKVGYLFTIGCKRIRENPNFIKNILYTNECRNCRILSKPTKFKSRVGIIGNQFTGPFIFPNRLTGEYFLDMALPHNFKNVTSLPNKEYDKQWIGLYDLDVSRKAFKVTRFKYTGLISVGIFEKNGLQED